MSKQKVIGLISDTHMPDRWKTLPERVFELFADVDLIIHAGDVGELWVLDHIGEIAPIVAVHGNDEPIHTQSAVPFLQTLSILGHRMVISHAHYPNRAEEMASRTNDWESKFERRATFASSLGASICIFGHTHIPMLLTYNNILLVNPGAIASGNPWTRQKVQTVAKMTLTSETTPEIDFYDLATGDLHTPHYNSTGFVETSEVYYGVIFEDHFMPHREWIWYHLRPLDMRVHEVLLTICHEVWAGERDMVTTQALMERFKTIDTPSVQEALEGHSYFSQYL
ncbi:MAG: metallophosphoesterase family protein [Chloroflexota bacterium]